MAYKKPQNPLTNNGFGIYPLTTADQVILSDGSRLEKNGQISIGGGTVKTVSGVTPDSAGNVALTASDVGALEVGGTAVNAGKLDGKTWAQALDAIYPVGAVYISTTSTSPASLFGGTWEQITDRFLLAAGNTYSAGSTGGEAEHALTIDETAPHSHDVMTHDHGNSVNNEPLSPFFTQVEPDTYDVGVIVQTSYSTTVGGGQPHNNMPPYLAVYMWKRVS